MAKNGTVEWNKAVKVRTTGEHLQVTVGFNHDDGSVTEAVCTYGLNNRDEGEEYDIDPDEFVSIPDSMVINGQDVRTQDLHTALQKVTGQSIKNTFNKENITKKANAAADIVKEGSIKITENAEAATEQAKKVAADVAKKLKESAEQLKENTRDLRHKAGEVLEKAGETLQQ